MIYSLKSQPGLLLPSGPLPEHRGLPGAGKAGFTLFEMLLVLVIFSLSIALVSVRMTSGQAELRARITAKKIASALKYARNRSLRERTTMYAESFADRIVISPGAGAESKKEVLFEDDVLVRALEGSTVIFYPSAGSSGGGFEVMEGKEKVYYIVKVEPSTGHVQVKAR